MSRSIKSSLLIPLLIGASVICTCSAVIVYASVRRSLLHEFDDALQVKAHALASLVMIQPGGRIEFDYSEEGYPDSQRDRRPEYFQIQRADGSTLARSASLAMRDVNLVDVTQPPREAASRGASLPGGRDGRVVTIKWIPLRDVDAPEDDERKGTAPPAQPELVAAPVFVTVARDTTSLDRTLTGLATTLGITLFALLTTVAVLVPIVVRRALRPVDTMATHAATLDVDSLGSPFPDGNLPGELAPITARLNDLLARLEAAFKRESRFSTAAAHELRTPIAEIRAAAEVALRWPEPAQSERALQHVVNASHRMESLIEALLNLARSRAGRVAPSKQDVNLSAIVRQHLRVVAERAAERELRISPPSASDCVALADPAMTHAIVENLIANAIDHAPAFGSASVELTQGPWSITLTVENDCRELTSDDMRCITEPFWTQSASRSERHFGLGLALVSDYAKLMSIPLNFELVTQGRFRASVEFPRGSAQHAQPLASNDAVDSRPSPAVL